MTNNFNKHPISMFTDEKRDEEDENYVVNTVYTSNLILNYSISWEWCDR